MMIKEPKLYKFTGCLLLLTGFSHMSQIVLYEPTSMVKLAATFGVVYTLMGIFALQRVNWLPWLAVMVCSFGFIAGTKRLIEGPFNSQFAIHQVIHIVTISAFIILIIQRRQNKLANL